MNSDWIIFAVLAYFGLALSVVFDKLLLEKYIPRPYLYAAYVGLLGFYGWFLAPFGFSFDNLTLSAALFSVLSGLMFIFALIFFYWSVQRDEISRIAGLTGAFSAVLIWFFVNRLKLESLGQTEILAFSLLILGGVLMSFRRGYFRFSVKTLFLGALASLFFAFSLILIKIAYSKTGFLNAYILGRSGEFLAGLLFLTVSSVRRDIFSNLKSAGKNGVAIFLGNKILAAGSFLLLNYAVLLGKISLIQAMQGLQYVFVLVLALIASFKMPQIFKEEIGFSAILQKGFAVLMIIAGIILLVAF
ncbi:MAG: hypothetical protein HYW71_01560 [Candidatus Niyogibacteria bacterium]|nr:hypothetical protein [Candidatus Niyogibacteria bacterium]